MNQRPCDCCEGIEAITPVPVFNRPGLDALTYRVGTHATFFESMKAKLSALVLQLPDFPEPLFPLQTLTTRESDDPAIALLDAWATLADVLTFYQERIANEGFLRTMTELRSAIELARLIGYTPRPGVASSVPLVFELEQDHEVEIPAGTLAQNIPGPNEMPQSFETSEPLLARAEWNILTPRMMKPQYITTGNVASLEQIYLEGTATQLSPNDMLLFAPGDVCIEGTARRVCEVEPSFDTERTRITLQTYYEPLVIREARAVELLEEEKPEPVASLLAAAAERYRQPEEYEVDPSGRMATKVVDTLDAIRERIGPEWTDAELVKARDDITAWVAELDEYYAAAEARGYTRLSSWLGAMKHDIEPLMARLNEMPPPEEITIAETAFQQFTLKEDLIAQLELPPSVPPANRLEMLRSNQTIYMPASDTLPQVLTALNPALGDAFYTAWANADLTGPPDYEAVLAMRVKAAVFGHNAPLKPVFYTSGDRVGMVKRYEEWPLALDTVTALQMFVVTPWEQPSGTILRSAMLSSALYEPSEVEHRLVLALNVITMDQPVSDETLAWLRTLILAQLQEDGQTIDEYLAQLRENLGSQYGGEDLAALIKLLDSLKSNYVTLTVDMQDQAVEFEVGDQTWTAELQVEVDDDAAGPRIVGVRLTGPDRVIEAQLKDNLLFVDDAAIALMQDEWQGLINGREADAQIISQVSAFVNIYVVMIREAAEDRYQLYLDREYDGILPGTCIVLERPDSSLEVHYVEEVKTVSLSRFGISGRVTRLTLGDPWLTDEKTLGDIRDVAVYAQPEKLTLAQEIIADAVKKRQIEVDGIYPGLKPGRWLIVSGERADIEGTPGVYGAELVMLESVSQGLRHVPQNGEGIDKEDEEPEYLAGDKVHSTLVLANPLEYTYRRDTVKIYGNVVMATHGKTRTEVLGSGDGSQANQQFTLKQKPLTYVSAPTPSGIASTLAVRINEVLWHEADNPLEWESDDREYITQRDADGNVTVQFGDGKHGRRLPSGVENVRATYRVGIGKPGNVKAESITQLMTRPLGVKGVRNPLAATGGADAETHDDIRRNAPVAMLALDRLVSVSDYADFARTFAGIGKAHAVMLSDGRREVIHVTIAGADDTPISVDSDLFNNVYRALHTFGDPQRVIQLAPRDLLLLLIKARVKVQPDYLWEHIEPRVRAALLDAFGFNCRGLGQDVYVSEVQTVIQRVRGVEYVDLDVLDFAFGPTAKLIEKFEQLQSSSQSVIGPPKQNIIVETAHVTPDVDPETGQKIITPAQLAYLKPDIPETLILTEWKP